MKRRIIAEIVLDEGVMFRNMEVNNIDDTGDIDYVVGEINAWCEQSGISVERCRIVDEDDITDTKTLELVEKIFEE